MRAFMSLVFPFVVPTAHANINYGTGVTAGQQCPYNFQVGQGAYSGNDEISNLARNFQNAQRKISNRQAKAKNLDRKIDEARAKIRKVIKSSAVMSEIERHYEYNGDPEDYSQGCGDTAPIGKTASAGSQAMNRLFRPQGGERGAQAAESGKYPVPRDYCVDGDNFWKDVVAQEGMVLDEICNVEVPSRRPSSPARAQDCKEGLESYYAEMGKRKKLETEIRQLKSEIAGYNDDKERIEDQISEGKYCPTCNPRSLSNQGAGNFALNGVNILGALFNSQPQQQQAPMLVAVPRGPRYVQFPGQAAYPGRPYAAPVPGYYGVQPGAGPGQGYYGGAPGAVGAGAFGCNGTSPFGINNALAPQFQPFLNSQANPFGNPFAVDPFALQNQSQFHPLLNPGFGPGFAPALGNGLLNYPLANQAPMFLPALGQNAFGPPGGVPYASPYGANRYGLLNNQAPRAVYMGNAGTLGNYTNNVYSPPYTFTPNQNFAYQLSQLRNNAAYIGGGSYQNAPPVMPYISSGLGSPIYTTPVNTAPGVLQVR